MSADCVIQPGDEVLIRGRVKQHIDGVGVLVELLSKTDQYEAWVRPDQVAEVIPAERTKTHAGDSVAAVREAIGKVDRLIETGEPVQIEASGVLVGRLRELRAGLVAELDAIGVPVTPEVAR